MVSAPVPGPTAWKSGSSGPSPMEGGRWRRCQDAEISQSGNPSGPPWGLGHCWGVIQLMWRPGGLDRPLSSRLAKAPGAGRCLAWTHGQREGASGREKQGDSLLGPV